jgi:ferric-dicitrate binding protein FerR (iron transport regulator)
MKNFLVLAFVTGCLLPANTRAMDLKQSKFTQVVNSVVIFSTASHASHPVAVNDLFKIPDTLRTGPNSRAELAAADGTITRVGANTIFSYDPENRTLDLQQGSLLFHSPHGKGGGTIRTGSATASVIGTTIIVTCTPNGGFKLLDLEGQAEVRFLSGLRQTLEPGQMTFILPGGSASPIVVFRLDSEAKGSTLVSGFTTQLDSQSKINSEITRQLLQILNGTAVDTGLIVGNNATPTLVQVVQDIQNINNTHNDALLPLLFDHDASIVGNDRVSSLPVNYPPLDSSHIFDGLLTPLKSADILALDNIPSFADGLAFLGINTPAAGFTANNLAIDTANIDLRFYAGRTDFDFLASGDLRIWQSLDFNGGAIVTSPSDVTVASAPQLPDVVALFAGGNLSIAAGSTLEADTGTFGFVANSFSTFDSSDTTMTDPNTLDNITFVNSAGDVDILSRQNLSVEDQSSISSGGEVDIESEGSLTLGRSGTISETEVDYENYDVTISASGSANLTAVGGNLNLDNTEIDTDTGAVRVRSTGGGVNASDLYVNSGGPASYIATGGNAEIANSYLYSSGEDDIISSGEVEIQDSDVETGSGQSAVNLTIAATGNLLISGSDFYADGGSVVFASSSDIDIENSTLSSADLIAIAALNTSTTLNGDTLNAGVGDNISANTGLTVSGTTITADPSAGTISLANASGVTTINNGSSMHAFYISVNSPDGILLDGTGGTYSGNRLDLTSGGALGDDIDVQNADLTAFTTINMAAHTINLTDVAFGGNSTVNLHSFLGLLAPLPNTSALSLPGFVNFIHGVTYGGTTITTLNELTYVTAGSGAGIHISTLP